MFIFILIFFVKNTYIIFLITARLQALVGEKSRAKAEARVRENEKFESIEAQNALAGTADKEEEEEEEEEEEGSGSVQKSNNWQDEDDNGDNTGDGKWNRDRNNAGGTSGDEDEDDEDEDEGDEQLGFLHNQGDASRSMTAALALLKATGDLNKKAILFGRTNDSKVSNGGEDEGFDYRDAHGRALSQKQKFRELCYTFHGINPSKKTKEKRDKAMAAQLKALSKSSSADSSTMKSLKRAQEATGNAFIPIQGHTVSQTVTSDLAKQLLARNRAKEERVKNKKSSQGGESEK